MGSGVGPTRGKVKTPGMRAVVARLNKSIWMVVGYGALPGRALMYRFTVTS